MLFLCNPWMILNPPLQLQAREGLAATSEPVDSRWEVGKGRRLPEFPIIPGFLVVLSQLC